jgi:hypothetical protein
VCNSEFQFRCVDEFWHERCVSGCHVNLLIYFNLILLSCSFIFFLVSFPVLVCFLVRTYINIPLLFLSSFLQPWGLNGRRNRVRIPAVAKIFLFCTVVRPSRSCIHCTQRVISPGFYRLWCELSSAEIKYAFRAWYLIKHRDFIPFHHPFFLRLFRSSLFSLSSSLFPSRSFIPSFPSPLFLFHHSCVGY